MKVLRETWENIDFRIGLDDIIPFELSGHPHMTGLRPKARDRLFRQLKNHGEQSPGLEIAKEVTMPLCLPAGHYTFIRGEKGARAIVAYSGDTTVLELNVHQMLGVYCSYYPTDSQESYDVSCRPALTVLGGMVDRLSAAVLTLDDFGNQFKITGVCKLDPVLDGPQVVQSVRASCRTRLLIGPNVPVPVNRSPDTLKIDRVNLRNADIRALAGKEPYTDPARKATPHRSVNRN
jgi:hypothetical protein